MIVTEAYRTDHTVSVCRAHYRGDRPLPADAPALGQVQDARDGAPCEFCEQEAAHVKATQ